MDHSGNNKFSEWQILVALAAGEATEEHLNQVVTFSSQEFTVRELTQAQILALRDRNAF